MEDIIKGLENYIKLLENKRWNKNLNKEIKFQKERLEKIKKK